MKFISKNIIYILFFLVTCLYLFAVWYMKYFLTLDGSSHLDMAINIRRILTGECPEVYKVFEFTPAFVPNWTGHFLMAVLSFIMPPLYAEKVLISLCIILLPLSALLILRKINKNSIFLAIPILLWVPSWVFLGGMYNFVLSSALFFLSLNWWISNREKRTVKLFIILFLINLLLYASHLLGFVAMCISIFCVLLFDYFTSKDKRKFNNFIKSGIFTFCAALPGIILTYFYLQLPKKGLLESDLGFYDKLYNLFFPMNLYFFVGDFFIVAGSAFICWLMLIALVIKRFRNKTKVQKHDYFLIIAAFFSLLLIFVPYYFAGGWYIEERLGIFIHLPILLWAAQHNFKKSVKYLIVIFSILLLVYSGLNKYPKLWVNNKIAQEMIDGGNMVSENSVIYSIDNNISNLTLLIPELKNIDVSSTIPPMTGYTTSSKCVASISNPHASEVNTFPLRYKDSTDAFNKLGEERTVTAIRAVIDLKKYEQESGLDVEYIIIRGNDVIKSDQSRRDDQNVSYNNFVNYLQSDFYLFYRSPNKLVRVFKKKS